uniref:L1 cell adhesion molecule, paralog a n=1 Tax=Scleropages formosus TaxID=113540 RepID=A0A8C9TS86_SCLFO
MVTDSLFSFLRAVKQPPEITVQPVSVTAFTADDISLTCEASGNPAPSFRWVKDGEEFDPTSDPQLSTSADSGSFSASGNDPIGEYQGKYSCYAYNGLGTAVSNEVQIIIENTPKYVKEKKVTRKVEEGESVVLKCNPPSSTVAPFIHWMDRNLRHFEQSERVTQGRDGNLYFANVFASDGRDDYTCHAQYISARTILPKEPISLTVTTSNSVLRNRRPQMMHPSGAHSSYLALRGSTLELECIPEGLPTPTIQWVRRDGVLSESRTSRQNFERVLRFTNISETDSGEYQCMASNSQGVVVHTYTVTVEAAPYWTKSPESQLYAPGETVRLDCQADGIPTPTITWSLNGSPISSKRTMVMEDVQPGDTAVYQCLASNKHGTALFNTYVYIIELPPQMLTEDAKVYTVVEGQRALLSCETFDKPDPPTLLQLSAPKDRSLMLSWSPEDDHNSPILEFVVEYEEQQFGKGEWIEVARVTGEVNHVTAPLRPFGTYSFRVTAINELGKSKPSSPSALHSTPPAAPDMNPEDVRSESTEPGTLVIMWEEMDQQNFNGPGFQYKVMWRQSIGQGPQWHHNYTSSPPFIVMEAGTFIPFEIKVQAVNDLGEGPEPEPEIGYSGEDTPLEAPVGVGVEVINSTAIKVKWAPVSKDTVRGHLLGYKGERSDSVTVETGANEEKKVLGGLQPYSRYAVSVTVFNSKGEGPPSEPISFDTPEGVPSHPTSLHLESPSETELTLHWTPPSQPNGVLTGYLLQYQQSESLHPLHSTPKNIVFACSLFFLCAGMLELKEGFATQGWFIGLISAIMVLLLVLLILCIIKRTKGGKYSVKDKEEGQVDSEARPMKDEAFGEYRYTSAPHNLLHMTTFNPNPNQLTRVRFQNTYLYTFSYILAFICCRLQCNRHFKRLISCSESRLLPSKQKTSQGKNGF